MVKNLPAMQETWVRFLGQEDPLEKETAIHSSTLAWKIAWTEEPDRLQSMGPGTRGHPAQLGCQPAPAMARTRGSTAPQGWVSMMVSDQEARQILQLSLAKRPTSKENPQGRWSRVSSCSHREQALDGV